MQRALNGTFLPQGNAAVARSRELFGTDKQAQGCAGEGLDFPLPAFPHASFHMQSVPFGEYYVELICAFALGD